MKLTIVIKVGPWKKTTFDGADASIRRWSGGTNEGPNLAARSWCKRKWPFSSWKWAVWDPFHNKSMVNGTARSQEDAEKCADEALAELIAEAEKEFGIAAKGLVDA